eukprot:scaffold840_cov265-Pinguiococcus_pyrenoidosus.AAC.15
MLSPSTSINPSTVSSSCGFGERACSSLGASAIQRLYPDATSSPPKCTSLPPQARLHLPHCCKHPHSSTRPGTENGRDAHLHTLLREHVSEGESRKRSAGLDEQGVLRQRPRVGGPDSRHDEQCVGAWKWRERGQDSRLPRWEEGREVVTKFGAEKCNEASCLEAHDTATHARAGPRVDTPNKSVSDEILLVLDWCSAKGSELDLWFLGI